MRCVAECVAETGLKAKYKTRLYIGTSGLGYPPKVLNAVA